MKILVVSKRHNMGIDSIGKRHGRLYEICSGLSSLGHEVHALITDYHPQKSAFVHDLNFSLTMSTLSVSGLNSYLKESKFIAEKFNPDIVFASGDALHIIAGRYLATVTKSARFVADLKDNYEYFTLTSIPFLKGAYVSALKSAAGVICVSQPLNNYICRSYEVNSTLTLENAIDGNVFYPRDKSLSRRELGLPEGSFLIGTAGAISRTRGMKTLSLAYSKLTTLHDNIGLILAGKKGLGWRQPKAPGYRYMGIIDPKNVPLFFSALDVGIICNISSDFGNYCYPQKYNEMIACKLPIIAANVGIFGGPMGSSNETSVFEPGNVGSLVSAIESKLRNTSAPETNNRRPILWRENILLLDGYLSGLLQ